MRRYTFLNSRDCETLVQDDSKVLDDGGEIPNLEEEVGGSIIGCEISSLPNIEIYHVVNCLMCFGVCLSAFCLQKKKNLVKLVPIFYQVKLMGPSLSSTSCSR